MSSPSPHLRPSRSRAARSRRHVVAALLLPLAALVLAAGCGGDGSPQAGGPEPLPARSNILLITTDTLRADHLGSYGYVRDTSPNLDALAAEGVRFDQPSVQWPKTGPSFASMFTSTYPKDNGIVRQIGQPLSCRFRMLAEELSEAGYQTHAVVANAAVAHDFYFDQGFDSYLESWKVETPDGIDPTGAEAVTRLAVSLLEQIEARQQEGDAPFFLWVHYLDPHFPYTPPGEWSDRFQDDEHFDPSRKITISDRPRQQMMGIGQEQVLDGRDELAFYVARYDAEIAYNDHWVGRLLEEARNRGLMDRTLTVFTSDHGESLGDHNYYFDHGRFSFQTCLRVPLIFHYPGVLEPRVDGAPVELIHLAPTILEAAGVELPDGAWMQGRSLTPRLRGEEVPAREGEDGAAGNGGSPGPLAFAEAGYEKNDKWQKVVRDDRFKLIFAQTNPEQKWIGGPGVRFTLFDLQADPEETENVADRHPEDLERLQRDLWMWENADRFPVMMEPPSEACGDERNMQDETRDILKSLGYLR